MTYIERFKRNLESARERNGVHQLALKNIQAARMELRALGFTAIDTSGGRSFGYEFSAVRTDEFDAAMTREGLHVVATAKTVPALLRAVQELDLR